MRKTFFANNLWPKQLFGFCFLRKFDLDFGLKTKIGDFRSVLDHEKQELASLEEINRNSGPENQPSWKEFHFLITIFDYISTKTYSKFPSVNLLVLFEI